MENYFQQLKNMGNPMYVETKKEVPKLRKRRITATPVPIQELNAIRRRLFEQTLNTLNLNNQ